MIIPIGNNCKGTEALRDLGIRKFSYPLDWVFVHNGKENIFFKFVLDILKLDMKDCREFALKHLVHRVNEYEVDFPHVHECTEEKTIERLIRLKTHFNASDKILFLYSSRYEYCDEEMYKFYDEVSKIKNVKIYTVNNFKEELNKDYTNITTRNFLYHWKGEWCDDKTYYDQTVYAPNMVKTINGDIEFFKEYIEEFN